MNKVKGKVDWFNSAKGYGFLKADNCDESIFVHYSAIQRVGEEMQDLTDGQAVE